MTSIGGQFRVYKNNALASLSGLDSLNSIGEGLEVWDNDALMSLNGLTNLASIGGNLAVYGNAALIDLTALSNLTSINGELYVSDNTFLPSLNGLDSIAPATISSLYITKNSQPLHLRCSKRASIYKTAALLPYPIMLPAAMMCHKSKLPASPHL
ncbi:MAG: hypothetical protein IPK25_12485 [Saprospiraceae bacterium]|nr:hypothetical protein [Saprospiraceae bacterium]